MILVCAFLFVSISAFESTILFPLIFMIILWEKTVRRQSETGPIILFSTLFLHLVLRYVISRSSWALWK